MNPNTDDELVHRPGKLCRSCYTACTAAAVVANKDEYFRDENMPTDTWQIALDPDGEGAEFVDKHTCRKPDQCDCLRCKPSS